MAFQNDRIKPSILVLSGFLFVSHTRCATSKQPSHEARSHPHLLVSQWDTEDPRSSWVAQGAAESCTKRPCTCELGHELHHSRRPLRANGMATGLHWSFGGCPALLHYLPVFALHWSARKIKSPALALQVQADQLGSPTAQDGAPTQLSP